MVKTIIFDFDGVILESVHVKTKAFETLFSDHPEHRDAIVDFHLKNGGMSRFDKFRFIYKEIFRKPLSEENFSCLCRKFEDIVFEEVIKCDFVRGAYEFLEENRDKYIYFIVSATPQEEIERILERRDLSKYFRAVYGSPLPKAEAIKKILDGFNIKKEHAVFVGDAINDLQAARKAGVRFIARDSGSSNEWPEGQFKIKDLSQLSFHTDE